MLADLYVNNFFFGKKAKTKKAGAASPSPSGCSGGSGWSGFPRAASGESGVTGCSGAGVTGHPGGHPGGFSGFSVAGPAVSSGFSGFSVAGPAVSSGVSGFSGTSIRTAMVRFKVSLKDWTDVCMLIKEDYEVDAFPGEILWESSDVEELGPRRLPGKAKLALVTGDDGKGKVMVIVDGPMGEEKHDATRLAIHARSEEGILWVETPSGPLDVKLHIYNHDRYEARDGYYVSIPEDSAMLAWHDGWYLAHFEAALPFGCDDSEVGLEHDIAFAAVAAAEWLAKAGTISVSRSKVDPAAVECQTLAKEWQDFYEKTSERLRRMRS